MPVYHLNGKSYNIPDNVVAQFEKDNPEATVNYQANGKTYGIPVSKRDGFLEKYPDAVLEGQQPKQKLSKQAQPQQPAQPQQEQGNALTNLRDKVGKKIVQGLDAIGAIEHQPAQQDQPQQGLQQAQIPQGFGQFNIQQANQMGAGRGPVSWEEPEPKEETVVDKQARMLQGKSTPQEQKQVQSRMQQRKEEIAYKEATGKDLRQPVLNTEFEAPTVSRDENGNILIGNTTDQDRVSAHQQVMAEQAEYDLNRNLSEAYAERDRIKKLLKDDEKGKRARLDVIMSGGYDPTSNELLDERDTYQSALRWIDRRIDALETYRDNGDFRGFIDVLTDPSTYSFGITDLADSKALKRIYDKIEKAKAEGTTPQLTESEEALARNYMLNQQAQVLNQANDWYQLWQSVGHTVSFMKDFAITGGGFMNFAKAGMAYGAKQGAKLATKVLGDYMTKNLGTKVLGKIIEYGGKGAGLAVGAEVGGLALNNTAQAASSMADIMNKQMGNLTVDKDGNYTFEDSKSLAKAALESQLGRSGENASELVGVGFDAVPGILGRVIQRTKVGQLAKRIANNKYWKGYEKGLNYLGLQSVWGEGMEEEYNMARQDIVNRMLGNDEPSQLFDTEQQIKTWETVGFTSMLLRVPSMIATGTQQANYYANRYNLNASDNQMRSVFGDDTRYQSVKSMIDEADNANLPKVINNLMNNAQLSKEEKQAMFMYANDLVKVRGFNIANVVAAAEGFQEPPKVVSYNIRGNSFDEVDAQGNVLNHYEFETNDEMKAALYESQQKRFDEGLNEDISAMKTRPGDEYSRMLAEYSAQVGVEQAELEAALAKPSMERTEVEHAMVLPFAKLLHDTVYDNTMVHEEQSAQDGANLADEMGIDLNNLSPAQVEQAQQITADFSAAQQALNQAFAADENLQQEVERLENEGMPKQGIVSTLGELGFRPNQVQAVIDYYNADAKYKGFVLQMSNKIDEAAANERQRHTLKGTIDGKADLNNVHTISDGTNEYYLVSGDITTDHATGRITGSGSGLIIGMDLDGSFVNISDTDGYSVMPVTQTLDQWEEAERIRLQEQMTATIDPTGSMNPQMQQPAEEQSGNQDNAEGEAGASTGTGANEPSAAAPSVEEQQPVQIPVDEKSGLKRYEQGVPVEQAIQDIQNDGFDVGEMADAYIAEAQDQIDKINAKKAKKPQDLIERKRLQDVITYYNNVKARWTELHPTYADAQPFIDQLNAATSKKKADEVLNAALQAGVNPAEIQPVHTQKVSDIITKEEEARKREDEITDRDLLLIRQYKDTPQGRAYLLDRKRVPSAEKRRKIAKLVYGDLFDDDFDAWRDLRELISLWLGKGRMFDPDSFGQALGWDMGVGKDAAKVSTMFTARRENGGDGMTWDAFVHQVWESSGGRFDTEEISRELEEMFRGAIDKYELTEYQLQSRALEAERQLQAEQARAEEAEEQPIETAEIPEGQLPFGPQPEDEERPAFLGEEEQQPAEESETEAQPEETQEESHQTESREQYLASHPLTEEQIMADTQANEDEKLTAIEYMKGEDDRAIAQFIYDTIYNRAQQVVDAEPSADALQTINETAAEFKREQQKAQDQKDIDAALKEFNDFLDNAKGSGVVDKFIRKGVEGNDKLQSNLFDAFTMTNAAQRAFLGDLLRLASKVGYAYIKSGVHDVQAWSKQMADSIGRKLKDVLGWDDSLIDDFIGEVWEQKYTVDGQRMKLREHAEKLKNNKEADQAVNVNKNENNEPENSVSLQQEAAKPAEELEGDSAEFAEQQEKLQSLADAVYDALWKAVNNGDIKLKTMQSVKALAKEHGVDFLSMTDLQELIEAAIVSLSRDIAATESLNDWQKFENIRRLYEFQPTLSARDNDRINKQQYSTPAPMAYLMGQFVSAGKPMETLRGLEPSAGNGMLTIALPKEQMHVNDIDEMRLSNLEQQGFGEVTSQDGTQPFEPIAYDVIVTNPPFGTTVPKVYDGIYEISALEHQMAINALESMKDDGRAAIIIGGNTEYKTNGAVQGKDRIFLNYLYSHYNVVDVINLDGKTLYSKQGTGYPVRMILINGRKEFDPQSYAPVKSKARAEQVKSYDELYNRVNDDILSNANQPASVHDTESGESRRVDDSRHGEESTQTGVRNVQSEGRKGQSSERSANGRSVRGVSGNAQSEERGNTVGEGSGMVDGTTTVLHGSRPETSESNGTATEPAREQRPESGGNDTERPVAGADNSERVGQRGAESSQSVQQPEQQRGLSTEKVPYKKQSSNPFTLQSLMPAEQADEVKKILEELGDVDQFLIDELGYSNKEELHKALAAEQIDSVAMAINQMNQGNAFIIGDQTGIGKGRQAAALIRYGVKKGGFPVFITVKKALFSDMYRDLCDIGSPKLRPFIWSADDAQHSGNVTDKDGNVIYQMPSPKEKKRVVEYINKYGKLPKEYDYVLTTYDSFKSGTMDYEGDKKSPRKFPKGKSAGAVHVNGQANRDALETLAANSFVIMDESHNAGGEGSNVSNYLQYITTKAKGITFLSATFAKRPGNMPIYSLKTAIAKAGVKVEELIDAVKRGGATFQEIMSKALTGAGQMIRRERDMTGVTIDWRGIEDEAVIEQQREQYDKIIGLFNDIIDFQRTYIDPIIDQLNDEAADAQGEVDHTPGTRDMGINNTPFASRTYNMVQQVLLSLKAEEAAKRAIEHLKLGRKPVITVANTNEGAADSVAATDGESMEMPDLGVNLKKGLQGTLRVQTKDANNDTKQSMIPFERLPEEARQRYAEIMDAIENSSSGLSLSPIDVIKNELKKAGYKVGELTGRQAEFVYNEDGTVRRVRRQDTDKKKVAADFNNGKLDALILNRSAGTGISLHASTKFKDQRQRIMIVAQAQGDVNDEVQIRGRIDRTGQVLRGMYEYVVSQIPSEQRLLMMLKAKLRSLDANTTSSQKSKFNEMQVQDIMNKYGDQIVVQYLAENPEIYAKLADPLKWGDSVFVTPPEALVESANRKQGDGATASMILGRMALLKVAEQEKMLDDLSALYQAEIDRLNEMGENDLEITEMPLKAKTLSKQVWEQGVDPDGKNPFADNTYVEKVNMDVLKKPMKASEVKASQERLLDGKTWEEFKQSVMEKVDAWAEQKKEETTATITERAKKKAAAEQERYVKGAKKAQEKNGMTDEEIERNGNAQYNTFYKQEMEKLNDAIAAIEAQKQVFVDALETFNTDDVYAMPSNIYDISGMTFEPGIGKLIDIKITDNMSPNASTLSFATLDGRRKITIPINGKVKQQKGEKAQIFPTITSLTAQAKSGWFGQNIANTIKVLGQNLDNWDKLTSSAARKDGYIITGNLLKALVSTREQGVGGKLISYTTDTGEVRQGILMPDNFEPAGLTSKTPISAKKDELKYNRDKVTSADGEVTVQVTNDWDWDTRSYNTLELIVPKSTKRGGKYFNDETLLKLMRDQFEGSTKMKAEFKRENLDAVMKRLDELGVTVKEEHNENSDTGRRYDEDIDEDELYSISGTDYQIGEYGEWNDELEQSEAPVFKNGKRVATIINGGAEFGFLAISTEQEGYATEDFYETEADALEALERLMETGDEHTSTEKVADGYYTVEEAQAKVDELSAKYPPITHVGVTHSKCNDKELFDALFGKNVAELMFAMGGPKVQSAIDQIRKVLGAAGNFDGGFVHILDKIIIFADRISKDNFEDSYFHENIHAFLNKKYGDIAKDGTLPLRDIAERFWNNTPEQVGRTSKEFVRRVYEKSPKACPEEFFTYCVGRAMADGRFDIIDKYIKDEADRKELEEILNALNYDRTRESESRAGESGANGENKERRYSISDSRQVSKKKGKKVSEHKSRIAKHIDNLVKKLGTKARTTVYHSFDELPETDKKYIREAEKRGRKVRGWYENGHIYLYLPHIDSEYQAEKTIWHETVAHHGLRELIGEDNLDKLLKQLWLTHKDGAMGEWVAERMQQNGWKLNEAIEEYLAREAEKNPFKEPGLWQRLRWMLAEVLHKMGFATDPTIADVQYLFWQSQNQLTNNGPMGVIKQQAFLHHLEREAANTPYVNMNAERVEDIYNPEAEGAYPDGKTIRHSEETDEEVIERLEKEPNVKVYRAMQLIDGKLYPPMAAKQNGKLVNPIELGKWEKADEHPEMADENGKFKLDKGNGKSLKAAYNPYIHTSTTMLNDQFSEAQNRPNLVVVEVEVPESELASGYKAEKAKDAVGKLEWKAGIIQGQLSGTREVILSRWDKPVRIVPTEEVAQHIADMIKGKVDVMPTNVVTPQQRAELEKLGVKFVKTDNRGFIKEGENAGKSYSSVYGKKAGRRYDEDIESPLEYSAKKVYDDRLNRVETVFSEAYQDAMVSLKTAQNAIAQDKDIPDSQNAYMAENLMHGKNKNEQDLYNKMFRDPLIATLNKIMNLTGMNWGDIDRYVYTKSGLERNREFFVRDWMEAELNKAIHSYEDLNDAEQDIYDRMAAGIETKFEDGDIDESERDKKLRQALQEAHIRYVRNIEYDWQMLKLEKYQDLKDGLITFPEYLEEVDRFIRYNIDGGFKAEEHDYSGFRAMFGDEEGNYSEAEIIDELMNTEDAINSSDNIATNSTVDTLWEQINSATKYGLERYREAGMRSDEQIDRVEGMFHWYVPMRGFKEETGEDMYQYFTGKGREKSYLGGLLKHAKGRGSEAQYPISTIFAMSYKAISDCNQNLVNQKLYRLCQANPNDLVILSDSWAVFNDITGEWEEVAPEIPEDASEDEVREITIAWEDDMRQLALENKAKKIKGKAKFDYKPMDKKKQSEHIVDVRINGQPKKMIVTGNPRMAQALNGQLRFEHGRNVFSKWNAAIKNFMASLFTSYSPTFALRNMFRDWTHFRMMLGVREGHGYASQANKYYRQSLFKMVGLFKKYREGKLDESNEMERDFKDFMDNGGITGFVQMMKIDDIQKQMEKLYKQQKQGKTIRLNNKIWEYTLGAIEAVNEGIENNARFATYRASRHYAGRTKARSAYDAKEITVNFNRKGAGSKTAGFKSRDGVMPKKVIEDAAKAFGVSSQILGEGRIFFNATVQAIATTFKNFQNADGSLNGKYIAKWAAKYAIPPFMFGLLLPAINKALANAFGGGDDDDPYANLAEWTRRRNICIYIGNDNFLTIPIGQELAAFLALGDIMAGNTYAPDLKPVDRNFGDEMVGVMNTFSPVDISTKITKGGLMEDPISEVTGRTFSVLAPLVAVEQNLGWTGRPIYREDKFQNDQYTPEYQMVYQSTNPVLVNASKLLHELGGGDDITRGKLEVNPAIIQYLWEQYTGGPGKVFSNTISIGKDAKDILSGNESDFNIRKVEGLKAFVSQGDDRTQYYRTQAKYRKYSEDAKKLYHDVKGYENAATTDPTALMKLEKISQSEDFVRMQIIREADKQLSQINKAANKAEGKEKKELRRLYNEQVKAVVDMLDEVGKE